MTPPMIDFQGLIEKSTDGDWLREMISFAAQRLMDLEVEGLPACRPGCRRSRPPCRIFGAAVLQTGTFAAPALANAVTIEPTTATATVTDAGRRVLAPSI